MSIIDDPHNTSTILGMILATQRSTTIHLWIKGHQFKSLKKKTWTIRKSVNHIETDTILIHGGPQYTKKRGHRNRNSNTSIN